MSAHTVEEQTQLVRRIIENFAAGQVASINIVGHCLKYVGDIDVKLRMATELDLALRLFREIRDLHRGLGWEDLERVVSARESGIPYPGSRQEFGVAYYVLGAAEKVAMESYVESSYREFAGVARTYVDASRGRPAPQRFITFASDPTNRPQAQQFLNRWLEIAIAFFGRPGTTGDQRAVALGLRSRSCADMRGAFLVEIHAFLRDCGLEMPTFVTE